MPKPKKEEEPKEEITLEDLARMVQEGFTLMADSMTNLDDRITSLDRKTEASHQDILHELKPLAKLVPNLEVDAIDHERRIKALERHTGIHKH